MATEGAESGRARRTH